jgi:hypothetical protein
MKITRREFLSWSAILALGGSVFADEVGIETWKKTCFSWMQLLIPEEAMQSEQLWLKLNHKFDNDQEFYAQLISEFNSLSKLRLPTSRKEINSILKLKSKKAIFLRRFNTILIEIYYGSELGWRDLGFSNPPQPYGFGQKY